MEKSIGYKIASAIQQYVTDGDAKSLSDKIDKAFNEITIKVWREDKNIPLPIYSKEGDACCDIHVKSVEYDINDDKFIVHTGLHFALPDNYEMEIRPRSSLSKTEFYIPNSPGTIDWGYRGEVLVVFKNRLNTFLIDILCDLNDFNSEERIIKEKIDWIKSEFPYKVGDRCAQLLVRRREVITWDEVNELDDLGKTERGDGGYGHTGGSHIYL